MVNASTASTAQAKNTATKSAWLLIGRSLEALQQPGHSPECCHRVASGYQGDLVYAVVTAGKPTSPDGVAHAVGNAA
jgi:hypothetical protein